MASPRRRTPKANSIPPRGSARCWRQYRPTRRAAWSMPVSPPSPALSETPSRPTTSPSSRSAGRCLRTEAHWPARLRHTAAGPGSAVDLRRGGRGRHRGDGLYRGRIYADRGAMAYSALRLLREGLRRQSGWEPAWRDPEPRPGYEVVIVGGGGHGLATAYYLAKEHGITDVAVIEKGYIGGGNTGRNTTIVRSNYLLEANAQFYELSLKLWEGLSRDLNFNVMFSQRGVVNLAHSDAQRDAYLRRGNAMRLNGIDAEWLNRDEVAAFVPTLDCSDSARFPIVGGLLQRRGGTARHDAVAWGYARAASARGVDIIQNCEATDFRI